VDSVAIGNFPRRCTEVVTMDVRAILVIGAPNHAVAENGSQQLLSNTAYALADVLGKPVVFRVIDRLKEFDIQNVAVITDVPTNAWPVGTAVNGSWIASTHEQLWKGAESIFSDFVQDGAELVVVVKLGAYAEIDYSDLLQAHIDCDGPITAAVDNAGVPFGAYVVSASRRNHAAYMFRNELQRFRTPCEPYLHSGYLNHLSSPNHMRQLAIEGLMRRIQLTPEGEQIKPGVWVARGAQVHKRARVLSPAFIGAGARVRAAAVITRCTALEHNTVVDCGTVVENVTTLPYTYLGAGLDVTHAVVGHSKLYNLKRGVEVEFSDPRLIGEASSRAPLRALGSLLSLASFFPAQLLRGLFATSHRESPASLPQSITVPATVLESAPVQAAAPSVDAGEFPSQLVIARRYGNE
jgi:NDP-sugar pyrophosphorylase family protein